jgi:transcriptional regulator with XRE-family HTH domain
MAAQSDASIGLHMEFVGKVVRDARRGRFSVEDLSARAGVSSGLISQVERGLGNPSVTTLLKLARALDLPLNAFFEAPSVRTFIVRRDERRRLSTPHGLVYELLVPDLKREVAAFRTLIPAGFDNRKLPSQYDGEQLIFLLAGYLEVHIGDEQYVLEEGDCLMFDATAKALRSSLRRP